MKFIWILLKVIGKVWLIGFGFVVIGIILEILDLMDTESDTVKAILGLVILIYFILAILLLFKPNLFRKKKLQLKNSGNGVRFDAKGCKEQLRRWQYIGIRIKVNNKGTYPWNRDKKGEFVFTCNSEICRPTREHRDYNNYYIENNIEVPQFLIEKLKKIKAVKKVFKGGHNWDYSSSLCCVWDKKNRTINGGIVFVGDDFPNQLSDEQFLELENIVKQIEEFRQWNAEEEHKAKFFNIVLQINGVTVPRAQELWEKFGCFEKLTSASIGEISEVYGIGKGSAGQLKLQTFPSRQAMIEEILATDQRADFDIHPKFR